MTIGIILGILFVAVAAVCAALAICFASGKRPLAAAGNRRVTKKPVTGGILGGAAVLSLILFLLIPFSFHTVQAGEVAVVKHLGEARSVRTAGTYFDFWITESYKTYDAKVQNLNINASTYSKDGQSMQILINVQYQMDTAKVLDIENNYGSLDALSTKIESVTEGRAKSVLANYSAMEVIENRADATDKVEGAVKDAINNGYYAYINTVVLTNIDFTDAFEKTVEDKMIAEQDKLKAEYEAEKAKIEADAAARVAIIEAEAKLSIAEAEAKAKIAAAEGDASAQKLIAQAEAYATQIKIVEIARTMGYAVTENTDAEGAVLNYEIEWGTGAEAEAGKKLLISYMEYLEYLSKWDGKLPQVVTDGSNIMIPVNPVA